VRLCAIGQVCAEIANLSKGQATTSGLAPLDGGLRRLEAV
jgi:hypothetical protein